MSDERTDKMVTAGVAGADNYKIQTAEALEEAARELRNTDLSATGEDFKKILKDVEARVSQFKTEVSEEYERIEKDYQKNVEPIEQVISEHPLPAVLIATGIGVLVGLLIFKSRD